MTKLIHPITFIDKLIKKNERGEAFALADHQREILRLPSTSLRTAAVGYPFFTAV